MRTNPHGLIIVGDTTAKAEDRPLNCGVCGAKFRMDQLAVYDRHMARCGNSERAEEMAAMSLRRKLPFLDNEKHGDVEYHRWFSKRRRAILEGRIKP